MCSLFGVIDYNNSLSGRQLERAVNVLAQVCEVRGSDATGIAYNFRGVLKIFKRPKPAHKLNIRLPSGTSVVMGHTRMATQGDQRLNRNNHPFRGRTGKQDFALAHNGMILTMLSGLRRVSAIISARSGRLYMEYISTRIICTSILL